MKKSPQFGLFWLKTRLGKTALISILAYPPPESTKKSLFRWRKLFRKKPSAA